MRIVIQRCTRASVTIAGQLKSQIGQGMLILLGIEDADTDEDIDWLCRKTVALRIFDDADGVMNLPITDVPDSGILLVSQFTLMASTKKGNREKFIKRLSQEFGKEVQTGEFGANMQVELVNDGPVTIIIDSQNRK